MSVPIKDSGKLQCVSARNVREGAVLCRCHGVHTDFIWQVGSHSPNPKLVFFFTYCDYFLKNKEKSLEMFPILKGQVASQ